MKVIILRGLPGSGKSTYVSQKDTSSPRTVHSVSADHYMVDSDFEYAFDPQKLDMCHNFCLKDYIGWVNDYQDDDFTLIVDNTNTTEREIGTYFDIAKAYNCDISIIQFDCSVENSFARNKHAVPFKTIQKMYWRLQKPLPSYMAKYLTRIDTSKPLDKVG